MALRVAPAGRSGDRAGGPGRRFHAAAQGGPARRRPRSRAPVDQGRFGEPLELVQGPRRERGGDYGPRVRVQGRVVRVHRQPRQRHRRARREGRHGVLRLRAARPGAREDPRHRGLRREGRVGQGNLRRREPALQRGRGDVAVGVREREPAAVLRRGLQVAGLRDGGAAGVAPARPRGGPHRVGRVAHEDPSRVQRTDRDRRRGGEALPGQRRAARGMPPGGPGVPGRGGRLGSR